MKTLTRILTLNGIVLMGTFSAFALDYDQNVNANGPASVGNDPGIYWGNGNANGAWTVDRENNIELGLRAHVRYPSPENTFNSSGNGNYSFTDSAAVLPANRASWNYDFSINVRDDGTGIAELGDFTFTLLIDSDPGAGHIWKSIDPTSIADDAPPGSTYIAQNSENPGFSYEGIPGYNKTIPGTYDFILSAFQGGSLKAQSAIRVNVNGGTASGTFSVPDAGSTALLSVFGIGSLICMGRKKRA